MSWRSQLGQSAGFPEWPEVMDNWGSKMLSTLHTTAQLVAIGLGLPQTALTALMDRGPHLLGPTGDSCSRKHMAYLTSLKRNLKILALVHSLLRILRSLLTVKEGKAFECALSS